jgi:hypothetical protein
MNIDQRIEALARSLQLLATLPAIAKKPALSAPPKPTRKWHDSRKHEPARDDRTCPPTETRPPGRQVKSIAGRNARLGPTLTESRQLLPRSMQILHF